jgi:hypothetical protein
MVRALVIGSMERGKGTEEVERWTASGELGIRGTGEVRRRRGLRKRRRLGKIGKGSASVASRGRRG